MGNRPEVKIQHMTVSFPAEFGLQADRIVRKSIDRLSQLPISASVSMDDLNVPAITLDPSISNDVNANTIAETIHRQMKKVIRNQL